MPITPEQAHQLAPLIAAARPYGARRWDGPGIVAALKRVQHLALADIACAAFRAASDRTMDTPAPIGDTTSTAWRERLVEPTPTVVRHHRHGCDTCGKPEADCKRTPVAVSGHTYKPPAQRPATHEAPSHQAGASVIQETE